jgi:hypothetical protein
VNANAYAYRPRARYTMSTIEEVRAAENHVKNAFEALRTADGQDQNLRDRVIAELKNATDEYARAVRELKSRPTALSGVFTRISVEFTHGR